jgi:flavin reductase (DIM6/NTAB) family NADH-FMN oxidoreductase RutF
MTLGWHMMLAFTPALVACYIWDANHSFAMARGSRECVINLPTVDLARQAVGIGSCRGDTVDKFARFKLTPVAGEQVKAPLIEECYANFECRLHDARLIRRYGIFVWEVVKAHVARSPKNPTTIHYRGDGEFMVAGRTLNLRGLFRPQNLCE